MLTFNKYIREDTYIIHKEEAHIQNYINKYTRGRLMTLLNYII